MKMSSDAQKIIDRHVCDHCDGKGYIEITAKDKRSNDRRYLVATLPILALFVYATVVQIRDKHLWYSILFCGLTILIGIDIYAQFFSKDKGTSNETNIS